MFRQTITKQARLFSTSVPARKSTVDSVKEGLHNVDKTISQQAVKGIDAAKSATQGAKETAEMKSSEAEAKAQEAAGSAKGTAQEAAGKAQGKASELAGEAKGKASELEGEAKKKTS
ncbi:hypothetical protein KC332_g2679 [Hortaea werneckii]|uniref:LEA domain-containing protein n=1 Tax=Hortaea werneckii TaxID=91943 RepID=A0A3M7HLF2_HORWE|nr:hypothetical protein KC350_g5810 [Hortaea werneckii]KAI6982999.1 hypothetical protein KC329_g8708 [Hortaea werneckii]KAI7034885.1 hypothetical protein KC366_g8203 [Hortaea werneckii]KAI7071190.1 hypothetical protein KC327_g7679 [Hortaea werneckii]KAI7129153.1 hypothetical protein KC337_g7879 [Hortaea werneckii]